MKAWRPFRFPPLIHSALDLPLDAQDSAQIQASAADGFRQGMDAGYNEGLASGEAAGREAGYAAGLEQGRQEGQAAARREALAELADLGRPLEAALAELRRVSEEYQAAMRDEVVELVAKVARQVIRCELALKPVQILDLVDETLAALPPGQYQQDEVEILLNAEECQRIRELAPERAARWRLVADPQLPHGECRIRTPESEADAGCQQRLEACIATVREQLQSDAAEPAAEQAEA